MSPSHLHKRITIFSHCTKMKQKFPLPSCAWYFMSQSPLSGQTATPFYWNPPRIPAQPVASTAQLLVIQLANLWKIQKMSGPGFISVIGTKMTGTLFRETWFDYNWVFSFVPSPVWFNARGGFITFISAQIKGAEMLSLQFLGELICIFNRLSSAMKFLAPAVNVFEFLQDIKLLGTLCFKSKTQTKK